MMGEMGSCSEEVDGSAVSRCKRGKGTLGTVTTPAGEPAISAKAALGWRRLSRLVRITPAPSGTGVEMVDPHPNRDWPTITRSDPMRVPGITERPDPPPPEVEASD
ncbi:unnamed protein product [Echinostoma caproni]|uniref:Uncharacterized protein n=1 Tax=Echinostoma caproni TaxID=27848 RepID=A0A183ACL6_9TREM|nr:unnamed protein product [Echinostoma caproni]